MNPQEFKQQWDAHIPEFPVTPEQVDLWFALHTEAVLSKGLRTTFVKWDRDKASMDYDYLVRYASKSMNNEKSRLATITAHTQEVTQ